MSVITFDSVESYTELGAYNIVFTEQVKEGRTVEELLSDLFSKYKYLHLADFDELYVLYGTHSEWDSNPENLEFIQEFSDESFGFDDTCFN